MFADCERLLRCDLDAVSIAVPTSKHKEIALKAANQGVHMLIEKLTADSLNSADAIIAAVRSKNLKLMIGHIERFNPATLKLKELISISGRLLYAVVETNWPTPHKTKMNE